MNNKNLDFTYDDMMQMDRGDLGNQVPLELFRMIRLIGINQTMPMGGKGTTMTIGRKIGETLPVDTIEQLLDMVEQLKIGKPTIIEQNERVIRLAVRDCFCKGLPIVKEKMVCDLEGAILEGALSKIMSRRISVQETQCTVSDAKHDYCIYEARL